MIFFGGCGGDSAPGGSATTKRAEDPVADGPAKVDGQTTLVTIGEGGSEFDVRSIRASPGVLTIRLRNLNDSPRILAIRQNGQVLSEGGPAAGEQLSEITVPVEAGSTYEYYVVGSQVAGLVGAVTVDAA